MNYRVLLLLMLAATIHAWAWGCAGHQIVALIALRHLDAGTRAEVDAILGADARPGRPTRACPIAGLPPLVAAANWADAVRNGSTAPEHYVDLPLALRRGAPDADERYARACAERCVSWAIQHYAAQLGESGRAAARGKALRYLIHFVGDAHQPLQDVDTELGGTRIEVYLPDSRRETSLHAAWDSGMLADLMAGRTASTYAAQLDRQMGGRVEKELGREQGADGPEAWVWESHGLAARYAFGLLPVGGGQLSTGYETGAQAIIALQLERAGVRLARLLAQVLAAAPGRA